MSRDLSATIAIQKCLINELINKLWTTLHWWIRNTYINKFRVNSLRPGDAYMRQWTEPSLDYTVVCCLLSIKPSSEPVLTCCQLNTKEHVSKEFYLKSKSRHSRECIDNRTLKNIFQLSIIWNQKAFIQENIFQCAACKMAAILSHHCALMILFDVDCKMFIKTFVEQHFS